MMERMDVVCPRPGKDGKSFFVKVGSAWPTKNGGWSISLDALPAPALSDKGAIETRLLLMPQRDDARAPSRAARAPISDDDGIPF